MSKKNENIINRQIEIKPNKEMRQYLDQCFGYARRCWNAMLGERKRRLEAKDGQSLSLTDISKEITKQKEAWEYEMPTYIKSSVYSNLSSAICRHFKVKGSGEPKFKSRNTARKSFRCPWQRFPKKDAFIENEHGTQYFSIGFGSKCTIPKDKRYIKMTEKIDFNAVLTVRNVTIFKYVDRYYASFCIVLAKPRPKTTATEAVGIDLGLSDLVVTSDGGVYNYPMKELKRLEKKANYYNKQMSRKYCRSVREQSKNYERAHLKYQKVWRRISRLKKDTQSKIASELVTNYAAIIVEDMAAAKTKQNRRLSHAIQNIAWGTLVRTIKMTAQLRGAILLEIQPGKDLAPTQTCSRCGHRFIGNGKLRLRDRTYKCPECGLILDRDVNAAINIKHEGLRKLAEAQPTQ